MAEESRGKPLLVALMKRSRLSWYWTITIISAVLLLLLILVAYLDGVFTDLSGWSFWRDYLDGPVLIIYILAVYPFIWRLWERAVQAFRPLLPVEEGTSNRLAAEVPTPNLRWEWAAVLIGVAFALTLGQPWNLRWEPGELWLHVYEVVTSPLMFGLLGWLIYISFLGTRHLTRLSRQQLKLDIFDTGVLVPIAQWNLGISFTFLGGISLSLVFQTQESLLTWNSITIYAVLVLVTVLIFFLNMWSTHSAMAEVKRRKLTLARKHLAEASCKLEDQMVNSKLAGMEGLSSTITAWATYERRVKEAPTWPFNAGIIRRLAASTLVPIAVFLIKVLSRLGLSP